MIFKIHYFYVFINGEKAARAGDAGKGFAVVASEVRTLAQRSSAAAKDITGLINHSTTEVAQGVKLVRTAGDALGDIVSASRKVVATVSEISAAATEQANGIDEMSQAVAHMDEMTQQNASLAEESAASATSLTGLIQRLNELVAAFRIQPGAAVTHAATSSPSEPERLHRMAQTAFGAKPKPATERNKTPAAVQRTVRKTGTGGANSWSEF